MTLVYRVRTIIMAVLLGLSLLQTLFYSVAEYRVEVHLVDHDAEHAEDTDSKHDETSHQTHLGQLEDWHYLLRGAKSENILRTARTDRYRFFKFEPLDSVLLESRLRPPIT